MLEVYIKIKKILLHFLPLQQFKKTLQKIIKIKKTIKYLLLTVQKYKNKKYFANFKYENFFIFIGFVVLIIIKHWQVFEEAYDVTTVLNLLGLVALYIKIKNNVIGKTIKSL